MNLKTRFILFLSIVAVNVLVFWPSFFHGARADHVFFLIETASFDNIGAVLEHAVSFTRTRFTFVGDQILFRPILFTFATIEKIVFGYQFLYWQLTGFLLHLCILWQLLKILNFLKSGIFAALFTLGFSILYISQEMVIWAGISGYLLALNFILAAFYRWILLLRSAENEKHHELLMTCYLALACFTFEYAVPLSFGFALMVAFYRKIFRQQSNIQCFTSFIKLLWPVGLYLGVSFLDYVTRLGWNYDMTSTGYAFWSDYVSRLGTALLIIGCAILLPQFTQISLVDRAQLISFKLSDMPVQLGQGNLLAIFNFLFLVFLVIGVIFVILKVFEKSFQRIKSVSNSQNDKFLLFIAATAVFFMGIYLGVLLLARNTDYLVYALYHFYPIFLFLTIAVYGFAAWSLSLVQLRKNLLKPWGIVIMILFFSINGTRSYQLNERFRQVSEPQSKFLAQLDQFVRLHEREKDFSFRMIHGESSVRTDVIYGKPDTGQLVSRMDYEFLFARYLQTLDPKYYLIYTDKQGLSSFGDSAAAQRYFASLNLGN